MDIKRALIISVITVVIVTSISVVSAEFDDLGGEYYNNIYETSSFTVKYPMGYTLTTDNKDCYNSYFEYSYSPTFIPNHK